MPQNSETRIRKNNTLEEFRQKSNDISLDLGDNKLIDSRILDKTLTFTATNDQAFFESGTMRYEYKSDETLDEPADKADVFMSVKKPAGTDVELYFRASDDADADLSNVAYTLAVNETDLAIPINDRKFQEVHFDTDPLGAGNDFAKIQFKIVMKSTNSAIVPEVKDFRAICST